MGGLLWDGGVAYGVDIWHVSVCIGRGQLNGGPFKVALKCLCLTGTKLTAQLPLHAIKDSAFENFRLISCMKRLTLHKSIRLVLHV